MQKEQRRKLWIGIGVGAIFGTITLVVLFIIFLMLVFFGGPAEVTKDVSRYKETMEIYKRKTARTEFVVFPEELPVSAQDAEFYFYYKDTWNTPTCEVYLQCTYDSVDYQAEIERLEKAQERYDFIEKPLLRDAEDRFHYPAYIAVDGRWYAFEYALLSGENQITYIYTAFRKAAELKKIDEDYLPVDFDSKPEHLEVGEGYYIY